MEVVGLIQILMVVAVNVIWCCFCGRKTATTCELTQRQGNDSPMTSCEKTFVPFDHWSIHTFRLLPFLQKILFWRREALPMRFLEKDKTGFLVLYSRPGR
jgi:hypothetical protein